MSDLFLSAPLEFEKVSAEVSLPEDPNTWPMEILQEVHKHLPYVSDFEPRIVMDKVDAERAYALGHVEVMNKTDIQAQDPKTLDAAGVNEVRIPIIVKDGKLQPFDILVTTDSQMLPLTESRMRQALFRPQMFDTTGKTPGDQSMVSLLYPPFRQNYGGGGGGMTVGGGSMGKEGSVASLLGAVLPLTNRADYDSLMAKLGSSRDVLAIYANNVSTHDALALLETYDPVSTEKTAGALSDAVRPTVAQLRHCSEGYAVKMASHHFWEPKETTVSRGQAIAAFGEKVVLAADTNGTVTMGEGASVEEDPMLAPHAEPISEYGIYECETEEGEKVVGFVFPNLIDSSGLPTSTTLFTNGQAVAVQGDIVGTRVGEGAAMFEGRGPKGVGAFYRVEGQQAECTVPFKVTGSISEQGQVGFVCETFDGRPVKLLVQPGIAKITEADEGVTVIPDSFKWMSLDQAKSIGLQGDSSKMGKQAAAKAFGGMVQIRSGGFDSFSLSGDAVEKLGSAETDFLSFDDALFVLTGLGVTPEFGQRKLAESLTFSAPISVKVGREITPAGMAKSAATAKAVAYMANFPDLRRDLHKEAASLPDPMAVDTVLSLGFINPENVTTFISYLPQLDACQKKLCEMLLGARLGLKELSTGALERSIKAVEEVIEGLKILMFKAN